MGRVDKYSIDVNCNCLICCLCILKFEYLVNKIIVNVIGLYVGMDCIMYVIVILGNFFSGLLVYRNIEILEKGNDIYI